MNNRLRKRFLGAGVVVALAAIILPFMLQGEGYKANRQLAESAQTKIPPRPPVVASLDTNTPAPPEDVRAAMIEPEPLPKPEPKPAQPVAVEPLSSQPEKLAEKRPAKPLDAPVTRPIEKPILPPVTQPVTKPAPAAVATQADAWLIQLGSFTAENNAQNLLKQVQGVGVKAKVERIEVKGSPVWRVTSGTYASRAEADAALKVLKSRLNLGGMVRPAR